MLMNPFRFSRQSSTLFSGRWGLRVGSRHGRLSSLAAFSLAFTFLGVSALQATPPGDPICGAPSSLEFVRGIRAQMASDREVLRRTLRLQQAGLKPRLWIERRDVFDPPRLILPAAPGQIYHLEATSDLGSDRWTSWLSVLLGDQPLTWNDDSMRATPFQFFRLRMEEPDALMDLASNFRLLDHTGAARDLYYHSHLDAIAVLAAGTSLDRVASFVPLLDDLARTYGNKLQIWILLSDPAPVRSSVRAQMTALKINFPVLFDQHNLGARSVGLTHAGEVALVQAPAFSIAYRGEVARPTRLTAGQSFLGQALASLDSMRPPTFLRTPVNGPRLQMGSEEIPDYARDIAPMLHAYCAMCHRPNGVGPFALTNYGLVHLWASSIKHALLSGNMPPWHADPEYGHFANDLSLPGHLKSALVRWIDAGAPRGEGSDPLAEWPSPPAFDEWPAHLGEPDALVTIPVQQIKATGSEPYRYLFVQTPNTSNVWLRAAIIRPSNYRAVHHYLIWPGRLGQAGPLDNSTYRAHIAEFVPGSKPFQIPPDAHFPLGKSNWLTFNLHYNTYGVATNDRPVLALWYHKTKPPKTWGIAGLVNTTFSIPPGARDYAVQAEWTVPNRITLHRLHPHMHVRGKRMKYEVFYPGGGREVLLSVPDYDFNWQTGYDLFEPKVLPKGSRIVARGAFDNSPQNLSNPDPSATVRWGDQSWMEMFIGYIDYTQ